MTDHLQYKFLGSILGPLLFILYINDLPNVSSKLFFILFADDTNVFNSHSSIEMLINETNIELEKVTDWFQTNKLTLNFDKTNYYLISILSKATTYHRHHFVYYGYTYHSSSIL